MAWKMMILPTLLVCTRDAAFVETLQGRLAGTFVIDAVSERSLVVIRARELQPAAFIGDFRELTAGGHAEGSLLDDLRRLPHPPRLIVVTGGDCPEPLARDIACQGARLVCDATAVVDAVSHLDDEPFSADASARGETALPGRNGGKRTQEGFVLSGLTRQYATNTPALRLMLTDLEIAARHDVTVLLVGETGSGKTYLSRLVHEISPRHGAPFVPLACGALPTDLIESELFGHAKGAFTSAHADKDGKFVAAGRGTILLDEIDALGPEQQVKLLRVIESGEFEPVGSNRTLKSEARLIVASNVDLRPLVEQKRFRADLYYRLNMLKFEIPPLRSRRPDIVPLAQKFIREQAARHGVEIVHVDENLFAALLNYPWPGNVRELEHVIQRAVIYSRDGVLSARQLPAHVVLCEPGPGHDGGPARHCREGGELDCSSTGSTLGRQVALSEREIILQTLFQHQESRTNAARALGISRVTLYNKMKKYGMMQK
jgi:DNA-binding NtrC family response regulator